MPKGCTDWLPSTARKSRRVSCLAAAAAAPTSWLKALTRPLTSEAQVHVSVWATAFTGLGPSSGPALVMEGDHAITDGQITVTVADMVDTTAYQMIISPGRDASAAGSAHRHRAEYADILGSAKLIYDGNTGCSGTCLARGVSQCRRELCPDGRR